MNYRGKPIQILRKIENYFPSFSLNGSKILNYVIRLKKYVTT